MEFKKKAISELAQKCIDNGADMQTMQGYCGINPNRNISCPYLSDTEVKISSDTGFVVATYKVCRYPKYS